MQILITLIYSITVTLQAPTIAALLVLFLWTLYISGGFVREWRMRRQSQGNWIPFLTDVREKKLLNTELRSRFFQMKLLPSLLSLFSNRAAVIGDDLINLKRLISEIELEAARACSHVRLGIRIGPMLGLIGTLIPMGPALKAIATGNVDIMSTNMIVAFSTTVIGLLVAGICYFVYTIRQQWYLHDISDIDYLMETILTDTEEVEENE